VEISVLHGGRDKVEPFAHSSYDLDGEGWALAGTEYGSSWSSSNRAGRTT